MPIDKKEGPQSQTPALLERIADMLGCSVGSFRDGGSGPLDVRGASELLTIWAELDDDSDRERLLEFARQLAASRIAVA